MFGLEKKGKPAFEFDLEKELKEDPSRVRLMLKATEERIHEIKEALRKGSSSKDFDSFGVLLHGFAALQRVLNRIAKKK